MKTWWMIGLAAIGVVGAAATAVEAQQRGGMRAAERLDRAFDRLDANEDDVITADEVRAARSARIERVDANGDGALDREELIAAAMERARARIERRIDRRLAWRDADGDGKLDASEVGAPMTRLLVRADRNGDGAVTRAEAERLATRMTRRGLRRGAAGRHRHRGDERAPAE